MLKKFPFSMQLDQMDCGPTCLKMISQHYGKFFSLNFLRERSYIDREGVSLKGISEAAEYIGMRTLGARILFQTEEEDEASLLDAPLPCIAHWKQNHFIVVYKINKKYVWVADPAKGRFKFKRKDFEAGWTTDGRSGIVLLLEPSPDFYTEDFETVERDNFSFLLNYLTPFKKLVLQLMLGIFIGNLFLLVFPFLTQAIVDIGIENQDLPFIYLILMAQLMVFVGQTTVNFIQSWILLHIGTRINVNLISDFLIKLTKLPIGFFDVKMVGDLLQRIDDHHRIESFLTYSTLNTLFSFSSFFIFSIILFIYNPTIFLVFIIGGILYGLWIAIFLKKRRTLDYLGFQQQSENQSLLIELIQGMQEIKLQNSERKRRWQWTKIQARLFKLSIRSLTIAQYQDSGAGFINQFKDILISFIAAKAVIEGQMTLGMMLAIQYVIGQLNTPLHQAINFIREAQDAKISLERLNEIHSRKEEHDEGDISIIETKSDIVIENLSFKYNNLSDLILNNINLTIPHGKVTAIVGVSGSGKTSLVKLLLGFYMPTRGQIKVGNTPLQTIKKSLWREKCGAVMQDGFLFSDTIANNTAESDEHPDKSRLAEAMKTANIEEFVESLPLKYNSKIGAQGNGLSQGQKQRLLIARAVYKDPDYLFFDEATNALDAKNEKKIIENMQKFFTKRTVVVVAHRLSTVKNADQIVVLDQGKIVEIGTHQSLIDSQGSYYSLVKNQLELGG